MKHVPSLRIGQKVYLFTSAGQETGTVVGCGVYGAYFESESAFFVYLVEHPDSEKGGVRVDVYGTGIEGNAVPNT